MAIGVTPDSFFRHHKEKPEKAVWPCETTSEIVVLLETLEILLQGTCIVRNIVKSGTPATTTTAATELKLPSITMSTTVFMPNTTQVQSGCVATYFSRRTSMNEVSW